MADNNLPAWLIWGGGISTAFAAWAGFALSIKRHLDEGARLTFLFGATNELLTEDDEQGEYFAPAIEVTITNLGSQPITLDKLVCVYHNKTNGDVPLSKILGLRQFKVVSGEPFHGWIELYQKPTKIVSIMLRDTTGKEWKPSRREMKQLQEACPVSWKAK